MLQTVRKIGLFHKMVRKFEAFFLAAEVVFELFFEGYLEFGEVLLVGEVEGGLEVFEKFVFVGVFVGFGVDEEVVFTVEGALEMDYEGGLFGVGGRGEAF